MNLNIEFESDEIKQVVIEVFKKELQNELVLSYVSKYLESLDKPNTVIIEAIKLVVKNKVEELLKMENQPLIQIIREEVNKIITESLKSLVINY